MRIYTDGATSRNGATDASGGWSFVVIDDNTNIIHSEYGHISNATNNICELTAILKACNWAHNQPNLTTIYSDSAYCINCYKQKWYKKWLINGWRTSKKESVANQALWEALIPFFENSNFNFEKVKGHSNDKWNNLADELAVRGKQC